MVVQIVRFRSGLPDEDVRQLYEARAPRYREVPGLVQKYYLAFQETNEHGAVYLWESHEALRRFRESDLARTIASAYRVQGDPVVQIAEAVMALRPEAGGTQ